MRRWLHFWILWWISLTGLKAQGADSCVEVRVYGGVVDRCGQICVDVVFRNFTNIQSMQFSLNWDPTIIRLVNIQQKYNGLTGFSVSNNIYAPKIGGTLRLLWSDPNGNNGTIPDDQALFTLCFEPVGLPGDRTTIGYTGHPLIAEFLRNTDEVCYQFVGNEIVINDAQDLCVNVFSCPDTANGTGTVTVQIDGGQPPYQVQLNPLGQSSILNTKVGTVRFQGVPAGSYIVVVIDANGKQKTKKITVGSNPIQIIPDQVIYPTCKDDFGSIYIRIVGGMGTPSDYAITWLPMRVYGSRYIGDLPPGKYTVVVRDSLGCEASLDFDFEKYVLRAKADIHTASSCSNSNDGLVVATAQGGEPYANGGYIYQWSKGGDPNCNGTPCDTARNAQISGRNQWVIVSDSKGCSDTVYFDVPSQNVLLIDSTIIEAPTCYGDSNGRAVVFLQSSNAGEKYRYELYDGNDSLIQTVDQIDTSAITIDSLATGRYRIRIYGAVCSTQVTVIIPLISPISITVVDTNLKTTCNPGYDGYIEIAPHGGNGRPYTIEWNTGATTPRIDKLEPGTYAVTVTDAKGCMATAQFEVTGPTGPVITGFDVQNATCTDKADGSAEVLYDEGSTPVRQFVWSNGAITQRLSNVRSGWYSVTITDENGCSDTDSVYIDQPASSLFFTNTRIEDPTCPYTNDGLITIGVDGGTPPYRFEWSTGDTSQVVHSLGPGTYSVTVHDGGGCPPITKTFTIDSPPSIDITLMNTADVSCAESKTCDGKAQVSASGGKDPAAGYTFLWSSGETSIGTFASTATALCAGQQWVVVSNAGCSDTLYFTIGAPPPMRIASSTVITQPACYGDSNGRIELALEGGTPPYRVIWIDQKKAGFVLDSVAEGYYSFFAGDDKGCLYRDSVYVPQPEPFRLLLDSATSANVRCAGYSDGRIVLRTQGGNPGKRQFIWSPPVSSDSFALNLPEGEYFIRSIDPKGCEDSLQVHISAPPPIDFSLSPITAPLCDGDKAVVSVTSASGGNGPEYKFAINNGANYNIGELVELFPGDYIISVFDGKGCARDTQISIPFPRKLLLEVDKEEVELVLGDSTTVCVISPIEPGDRIIWMEGGEEIAQSQCIDVRSFQNTQLLVRLVDKNGCEVERTVVVRVINRGQVYIPNAFNPTGSINTRFTIYPGVGVQRVDYMRIYSRWGELVYSKDDFDPDRDGWDGKFGNTGRYAAPGVYVYVFQVTFLNGEKQVFRGDVTLIR